MRLIRSIILTVGAGVLSQPAFGVDGVIEINQTKAAAGGVTASDTAGFPVTISAEGSYRLTGNLNTLVADGGTAIEITADRVTLDLNGFTITTVYAAIDSAMSSVRVANGSVRNLYTYPIITVTLGDFAQVDHMKIEGGISMGDDCRLVDSFSSGQVSGGERCLISGNTLDVPIGDASGIVAQAGSRVLNNTVMHRYAKGIIVSGGNCVVSGNTVAQSYDGGIAADDCVIEGNHVTSGGGPGGSDAGIRGHGSVIKGNVVSGVDSDAIVADNATVIGNVARSNSGFGLSANGATGYKENQFDNNNGGNANPQVSGGIEIGSNVCGGDTTCP